MELEKNSKFKIYLVITIFIMIILLSAYVVISKVVAHQTILDYNGINMEQNIMNPITQDSKQYIELSLGNDTVVSLYKLINNIEVEEKLYLMKNSEFDWSKTSSVVLKSSNDTFKIYEDGKKYIDVDVFNLKYNKMFGDFKIGLEKESTECDSVSLDISTNRYLLNDACIDDGIEMKTFLKNITYDENRDEISINKYYIFTKTTTKVDFYTEYEGKDLFLENDLKQIIAQDIKEEQISDYIYNMNVISYIFKKGNEGRYHLTNVS